MDTYKNGRRGLTLIVEKTQVPLLKATIDLHSEPMAPDEVAIKGYSENKGLLTWLVANRIVRKPSRYVTRGVLIYPICKLVNPT